MVSEDEKTAIEGAMTEIGAGRCMFPKNEVERTWNNACERALNILSRYRDGEGLFQIVKDAKPAR
jgi:hypothetical protein